MNWLAQPGNGIALPIEAGSNGAAIQYRIQKDGSIEMVVDPVWAAGPSNQTRFGVEMTTMPIPEELEAYYHAYVRDAGGGTVDLMWRGEVFHARQGVDYVEITDGPPVRCIGYTEDARRRRLDAPYFRRLVRSHRAGTRVELEVFPGAAKLFPRQVSTWLVALDANDTTVDVTIRYRSESYVYQLAGWFGMADLQECLEDVFMLATPLEPEECSREHGPELELPRTITPEAEKMRAAVTAKWELCGECVDFLLATEIPIAPRTPGGW